MPLALNPWMGSSCALSICTARAGDGWVGEETVGFGWRTMPPLSLLHYTGSQHLHGKALSAFALPGSQAIDEWFYLWRCIRADFTAAASAASGRSIPMGF